MRLEIAQEAEADLAHIRAYIRRDNPTAARQIVASILDQIQVLQDQSGIGRLGRIEDTREMVITGLPYIVCYAVSEELVTVLRVLHGRQQWPRNA